MEEGSSPAVCLSPSCQEADSQCPICLGAFSQRAFTDPCFHSFCFPCILQWAKVSSSCPLCKTSFTNIIYDVRAIDLYRVYEVKPPSRPTTGGDEGEGASSSDTRRFWYRSSLVPGQPAHRRRVQRSREAATEERRRLVYSVGLRVKPLPVERGRVRVRDISARFFRHNPASVHRLIPWLVRELKVLVGRDHTDFMVQLILSLVNKVDVESSAFAEHIRPFLHGRTEHFMHEFVSFAKSPYDMVAFDERSSYDFAPHNPNQDQPGPSGAPGVLRDGGLWSSEEPHGAAPFTDSTLAGESWESPPIHLGRDRPSAQATPTHFDVIDLTTPESSHASQPTPTEGQQSSQAVEGGDRHPAAVHHSGHSPLDQTSQQQRSHKDKPSFHTSPHGSQHQSRSHSRRSCSPSHRSRSPSHRSSSPSHRSRSPSHRSHSPSHRSHSPSHRSKHRSPSHRSKHGSPSHRPPSPSHRSCSPSHRSKHRSPSHRSKHGSPSHRPPSPSHRSRSPSHRSKHRSPSHRSKHRSPSHRSKHRSRYRHRSPSVSSVSRSKGKERARDHRSRSRAVPVQDRSVSTSGLLQEELSSVEEEIRSSRAKLLHGLLRKEKTAFLQSRLQKEHQPMPHEAHGAAGPSLGWGSGGS